MNILDIMTKIPGLGGLVDKAPQAARRKQAVTGYPSRRSTDVLYYVSSTGDKRIYNIYCNG